MYLNHRLMADPRSFRFNLIEFEVVIIVKNTSRPVLYELYPDSLKGFKRRKKKKTMLIALIPDLVADLGGGTDLSE